MHEVSLVHALFDQADRAIAPHSSAAVYKVTVRIGALAGVECELFRTAFEGVKDDRGYWRAALEIVEELAAWTCAECGAAIDGAGPLRCGICQGTPELSAGGDLILQRLELEASHV